VFYRSQSTKTDAAVLVSSVFIILAVSIGILLFSFQGTPPIMFGSSRSLSPEILYGALAIVLVCAVALALALHSLMARRSPVKTADDAGLPLPVGDGSSSPADGSQVVISPEMQFALTAAFDKLKQSREELEKQIAERSRELTDTLETSTDIVAAIPSGLMIFKYKAPDRLNLVDANPEALRLFNAAMTDMVGHEFIDLWPGKHGQTLRRQLLDVMQTRTMLETEHCEYGDEGLNQAYRVRGFTLSGDRLGVAMEEITARKKAEEELKRERDRTQLYLDMAGSILMALDTNNHVAMINEAGCQALERSQGDILGRDWIDFFVPEKHRGKVRATFKKIIAGRLSARKDYRFPVISAGGQEKIIAWQYSCLTDALGHVTGLLCSGQDVTEHMLAEEAREESEKRLQVILDTIQAGILLVDPETETIVDVNPFAASMFRARQEDIVGRPYTVWVRQSENGIDEGAVANRVVANSQQWLLTAQGGTIPVLKTTSMVELSGRTYRLEGFIDITDRMAIERALRQSEEDYRRLFENAQEGICLAQGGKLVLFNPQIVETLSYPSEYIRERPFIEFIHPEDQPMVADNHRRRLAGEKVASVYSFRIINGRGETRWMEIRAVLLPWQERPATLNFITDITERRQAEERLRQNEETYRLLTENLRDVVAKISIDGHLEYVSPAIRDFGGYIPEEEIGSPIEKYFADKNEAVKAQELLRTMAVSGDSVSIEFLFQSKAAKPFYVETTGKPVMIDGVVTSIQCVMRDITERKQAEATLRESEQRFRSVLESVPNIAVQGYDRDHRIIFWNQASETLYGYSKDEVLGKKLEDLAPESNPESRPGERGVRHKDGSIVPVYSSHLALHNIHGEVEIYTLDVDLTELKKAQKQQRILQEKLERIERMESLGVLAGGVAHDLNNMLGPMVGYSDIILKGLEPNNPLRKNIERIGKSAQAAADIIQDLLTMARRGRYDMVPTNLNQVIHDYMDTPAFIKLRESHPRIQVQCSLDSSLPPLMGSAPHLSKVIMNLVVNAFDAMADGGSLTISTESARLTKLLGGYGRIPAGPYLIMRLRDTGIGISEDDLSKIFEPYYSKKKLGISGSGLGLAVVYGIVKDHKGYYDVFSAVGEGAEFVLYFPACQVSSDRPRKEAENIYGSESILVVDDSEEQRLVAVDLLSNLGYSVATVSNGREAIAYLKEKKADLVIMDMIMDKDYDGLDAYRDILKLCPDQKTIIISGFSATERVETMQKLGAGAYVRKPFTLSRLGLAVRAELDKSPILATRPPSIPTP